MTEKTALNMALAFYKRQKVLRPSQRSPRWRHDSDSRALIISCLLSSGISMFCWLRLDKSLRRRRVQDSPRKLNHEFNIEYWLILGQTHGWSVPKDLGSVPVPKIVTRQWVLCISSCHCCYEEIETEIAFHSPLFIIFLFGSFDGYHVVMIFFILCSVAR